MPDNCDVAHANIEAMRALVRGLVDSGVQRVCIAPGSRSTPIVVAIAESPNLDDTVVLDERAGAFFALGMAKRTGTPVAIVCTSGTAAANFYPAVAEASLACVPLIVLTADRPPELRGLGAPQTIDQVSLYGSHTRASTDVPPPSTNAAGREGRTHESFYQLACDAANAATRPAAGPVHLNLCFREPLIGEYPGDRPAPISNQSHEFRVLETAHPDAADVGRIANELRGVGRGVIVCGPLCCESPDTREQDATAITGLARRLGWPIIADVLSGLRFGAHDRSQIVATHDVLLRDPTFRDSGRPDYVLRLGAPPIVKSSHTWLSTLANVVQTVVCEPGLHLDHVRTAANVVSAVPATFCEGLLAALGPRPRSADSHWLPLWTGAGDAAARAVQRELEAQEILSEPAVAAVIASSMPSGSVLFVGNSMPVRDLDTFASTSHTDLAVLCNRGANGIDGVVSAALGVAAVSGPAAALVGDLCFLHDVAALQLAALHSLDMTLVVVNNDGGGVFSFLPQAGHPEIFERYFSTPHGLDLGPIARSCGARHTVLTSQSGLRRALQQALARPGLDVLEVPSDRAMNVEVHDRLLAVAADAVHAFLADNKHVRTGVADETAA